MSIRTVTVLWVVVKASIAIEKNNYIVVMKKSDADDVCQRTDLHELLGPLQPPLRLPNQRASDGSDHIC